jgi:hypothetical protein
VKRNAKGIGLAIIGGGRVGLFRGEVAARHPAVEWIGLAEKNPNRAGEVAPKIEADFVTQSHRELLSRPEVTCAIIATDEHLHVDPIPRRRARRADADREAVATDLVGRHACSGDTDVSSTRSSATPSAVNEKAQREGAHRRARRYVSSSLACVHEPPGRGDATTASMSHHVCRW